MRLLHRNFVLLLRNLLWLLFYFLLLLVIQLIIKISWQEMTSDSEESNYLQPIHTRETSAHIMKDTAYRPPRTKVLILTYQRSGSSFIGELFNRNPGAVYWYEPLDGAYSAMYGTAHGFNGPQDITNFPNGTIRNIPIEELNFLVDVVDNLFNCRVKKIPTEILGHYFLRFFEQHHLNLQPYLDCINQYKITDRLIEARKSTVKGLCADEFSPYTSVRCYRHLGGSERTEDGYYILEAKSEFSILEEYKQNSNQIRKDILRCEDKLTQICENSELIVLKSVRLTMDAVEALLKRNPDLAVIHNIRDPRGASLSLSDKRGIFQSHYSNGNIVKEAEILCKKVNYDVKKKINLETKYPDTVLPIIYEDVALKPNETLANIYNFLGLAIPPRVKYWLHVNTEHSIVKGKKTDSKEIATKWMKTLPYITVRNINQHCMELFQTLDYPWSL